MPHTPKSFPSSIQRMFVQLRDAKILVFNQPALGQQFLAISKHRYRPIILMVTATVLAGNDVNVHK